MKRENDIFKIVTQISEEQKEQLYALIGEFETECEEKIIQTNYLSK